MVDRDYFIFFLKCKYLPAEYKIPEKKFNPQQLKQLETYLQEVYILLELKLIRNILQFKVTPTAETNIDIDISFIKSHLINIGYENFIKPGELSKNLFSNFLAMFTINIPLIFTEHFDDVSIQLIELIRNRRIAPPTISNTVEDVNSPTLDT